MKPHNRWVRRNNIKPGDMIATAFMGEFTIHRWKWYRVESVTDDFIQFEYGSIYRPARLNDRIAVLT